MATILSEPIIDLLSLSAIGEMGRRKLALVSNYKLLEHVSWRVRSDRREPGYFTKNQLHVHFAVCCNEGDGHTK